MKSKIIASFLLFVLAAGHTQAGQLLPPSAADLVATRGVSLPVPAGGFERQPVSFSWGLDPQAELRAPTPFIADSREFWLQVDAAQLRGGVEIDTSAPGALIRISPASGTVAVAAGALRLSRDGREIEQSKAFAQLASSEALRAAGMEVPQGSAVVRLAPDLGKGRFRLRLPQAQGRHLLHVFEPHSPVRLRAEVERANLLAGDTLKVSAHFEADGRNLAGGDLGGLLVSPSGESFDLRFVGNRSGGYEAYGTAPAALARTPGLWEVQIFAGVEHQGLRVQRDARTVVAIAQPTARFSGEAAFDAHNLRFDTVLQVDSSGRYQSGAVLYATAEDGVARPVSQAQVAAWLEPGLRSLSLSFDRAHVPGGYGAPYEVRFLELKDQTRMGLLETRDHAARIPR
jgi:hypothetical protein